MKKKIFIRVDGNKTIGYGHFYRCLALADFLEDKFDITVVSKDFDVHLKLVAEEHYSFRKITNENEFLDLVPKESIIIVDGYQFDLDFYRSLKDKKAKVVSVQDVEHFSLNVDLVLNHLPEVERYYNVPVLAGPKYAIVRKKILKAPIGPLNGVNYFISLGGTENHQILNRIILLINKIDEKAEIDILTTSLNKNKLKGENIRIFTEQNEDQVLNLIENAKICLITPGMISYEVLARNNKAIVGALNNSQETVGKKFGRMHLVEYVGLWEQIDQEKLKKALPGNSIDELKVKSIFDGKSDERILNKILQL